MSNVNSFNCNLNIWYYLDDEVWDKVPSIYESMEGWLGFQNGIPYWFGYDEDEVYIEASIEPSGLSFYAQMEENQWIEWIGLFKLKATDILGFEVGEPEDGFK